MGIIINIANQKGGVGKTTTTVNIGTGLSLYEKKVLVIDFDPQGNTTTGFGIEPDKIHGTIYDVLSNTVKLENTIIYKSKYLGIIPSNEDLSAFPIEVANNDDKLFFLKNIITPLKEKFDYIIIDSPPSLNLLTLNTIVACDGIIIPVQAEFYALQGLSQLLKTIKKVENSLTIKIKIIGFLLTMYDIRTTISKEVYNELLKYFNGLVFKTIIPRNVRIAEAPSYGKSVLIYAPDSKGAFAYKKLVKEIMERTYE